MTKDEIGDSPKGEAGHQGETPNNPSSTPQTHTNDTVASSPQSHAHNQYPGSGKRVTEKISVYHNQSPHNSSAMTRFLTEGDGPWTVFGKTGYPVAEPTPYVAPKTTTEVATHGSVSSQGHDRHSEPEGGNGKVESEVKSACDGTQPPEDEAGVQRPGK